MFKFGANRHVFDGNMRAGLRYFTIQDEGRRKNAKYTYSGKIRFKPLVFSMASSTYLIGTYTEYYTDRQKHENQVFYYESASWWVFCEGEFANSPELTAV